MAIAKMNAVSVTGPLSDFNEITKFFVDSSFHPESALSLIKGGKGFFSFSDENKYALPLSKISDLAAKANIELEYRDYKTLKLGTNQIDEYLDNLIDEFDQLMTQRDDISSVIESDEQILQQLTPFIEVETDLDHLFNLKYVKARFGKMPTESYHKYESYTASDLDALFIPTLIEKQFTYGLYFVPKAQKEKADTIFTSLHFERIHISDKAKGKPKLAYETLKSEIEAAKKQLDNLNERVQKFKDNELDTFLAAYSKIKAKHDIFNVRKYAVHTTNSFYIVGWVPKDKTHQFTAQFKEYDNITVVIDDAEDIETANLIPPTKLKNPWIFRPFEYFVSMYGVPNYKEIDPTPLVALTYMIMFGIMFGDVGQGAVLFVVGLLMYKLKGMKLGKIMCYCSVTSVAFGFFYGSLFGNEEILPGVFKPLENADTLNTTLIMAVVIGVIFIVTSMIINIVNGIRQKNTEKLWFSANGVAGMILYLGILSVALILFGIKLPFLTPVFITLTVIIPIILVFFREPLGKLLAKRKDWKPESFGGYVLENIFEMFEVLLSYLTNTISFVRVGAFALSHAGMMMVVYTLAEMMGGAAGNIITLIFGNILVMALEGLIVGIQVLRLEFYEIFGKFYEGSGKEFTPLTINYSNSKNNQ